MSTRQLAEVHYSPSARASLIVACASFAVSAFVVVHSIPVVNGAATLLREHEAEATAMRHLLLSLENRVAELETAVGGPGDAAHAAH